MSYEWIGPGRLARVGGDNIQPGEEFTPTESELESFSDRIERRDTVDVEETASEAPDKTEERGYEDMDYAELRQLAVEVKTDEINGRSSKDDIISYFKD